MKINEQSPTQWRMPREVTEKSSYLNRTGSVFYIGRHCEEFFLLVIKPWTLLFQHRQKWFVFLIPCWIDRC